MQKYYNLVLKSKIQNIVNKKNYLQEKNLYKIFILQQSQQKF